MYLGQDNVLASTIGRFRMSPRALMELSRRIVDEVDDRTSRNIKSGELMVW